MWVFCIKPVYSGEYEAMQETYRPASSITAKKRNHAGQRNSHGARAVSDKRKRDAI
jgi:hypothetical protein